MVTSSLTAEKKKLLATRLRQQLDDVGGDLDVEREEERDSVNSLHDFGVHDKGEASAANSVVAVERALILQHERERSQVLLALERLRADCYGECTRCGLAIDVERLMIEPAASRCLPCQEQFESE